MRLAEALALRQRMQTKIGALQARLNAVAVCPEGDKPSEDPKTILGEIMVIESEMYQLVARIYKTNATKSVSLPVKKMSGTDAESTSLMDVLARREMISKKRKILAAFLAAMQDAQRPRFGRMEIKFVPSIPPGDIQKEIDELTAEFGELDSMVQSINWRTELI